MTTWIDLTNFYLLLSIVVNIFGTIGSIIVFRRMAIRSTFPTRAFFTSLFIGFTVVDYVIFVRAVQDSPYFHFGFAWGVVLPTVLFYCALVLVLDRLVRAVLLGFTLRALEKFIPGLFYLALLKVAYVIAYASPAATLLTGLDLLVASVKARSIRDHRKLQRAKED
jgi:hypothetical protein